MVSTDSSTRELPIPKISANVFGRTRNHCKSFKYVLSDSHMAVTLAAKSYDVIYLNEN